MNITRRHGLAVGLGLATLSGAARAAAPLAKMQAPSFYRTRVGDTEITMLNDGIGTRPLAGFVRNASDAELRQALGEAFLPNDVYTTNYTPMVINTGRKLILIDTGNGEFGSADNGLLLQNFLAAGFMPDQLDAVVFSHFHPDHYNGFRRRDGSLVFPNAEVMVPEPEWNFWMDDARMTQTPEAQRGNFMGARRALGPVARNVTLYRWGQEVAPGVLAIAAPGHTPGHTVFAITSGTARFMMMSDITNNTSVFVKHPDWSMILDLDGEMARQTRHRMLDMAAAEGMECAFYHAPFPSVGHILRTAGGYELVPSQWVARL